MTAVICSEAVLRRIADRVNQRNWSALSASMKAATIESAIYCELESRPPDDTVSMRELLQLRIRACRHLLPIRDLEVLGIHDRMGE